ncbi:hypothetical protein OG885_43120 [Streptomyces sp. NBC_00028]|uniref:hypothetical protein n=1 Tax=Streptomyces sp. NBC_00028 TaxID=2975624 RepID=UPI003243CEB9
MTASADDLVAVVVGTRPFTQAQRRDGTALPDYLDGHRILGDPPALARIASDIVRTLPADVDHVAGEVAAGAALAAAVCQSAFGQGRLPAVRMLRPEPKKYGVTGVLNTPAVQRLRALGHQVLGAWVVVDRGDGAGERLEALGVPLRCLLTLDDLRSTASG